MQVNLGRRRGLPLVIPAGFAAVFLFAEITLIEQGRAAINRGDSGAAIEILEKAVAQSPQSAEAHSYFGQYHANVEKNYTAASQEFETALKLDPHYMPAFYHLGRTASLANTNLARGEEALKKYVAYTPKGNEPTLANAHYYLGDIYEKEGKTAEAKQAYQAALKLNPTLTKASDALKRAS